MSQENVEIARKLIDALNRCDDDAVLALTQPDVEFRSDGLKILWTFAGDRVLKATGFLDRTKALEAAGLRE
jgi:hypothetical protein